MYLPCSPLQKGWFLFFEVGSRKRHAAFWQTSHATSWIVCFLSSSKPGFSSQQLVYWVVRNRKKREGKILAGQLKTHRCLKSVDLILRKTNNDIHSNTSVRHQAFDFIDPIDIQFALVTPTHLPKISLFPLCSGM